MKPVRFLLLSVLLVLLAHAEALPQPSSYLNGRVARITDGDTVWIQVADRFEWVQVRFYGVDAPESEWPDLWPAQPFSAEAKKFLVEKTAGRQVSVQLKNDTTYGRTVGEIFVNGKSLSRELLKHGLAWWNKKYAPDDLVLKNLQEKAKSAKLGLWSQENPVPPWEHRRRYRQK